MEPTQNIYFDNINNNMLMRGSVSAAKNILLMKTLFAV